MINVGGRMQWKWTVRCIQQPRMKINTTPNERVIRALIAMAIPSALHSEGIKTEQGHMLIY